MARWRSAVILVQDGRVALIERRRSGRLYYVFPGGGIEPGESPAQAAIREVQEELGLEVRLGPLLARVFYRGNRQYYFRATEVRGHFGTGSGPEMDATDDSATGSYKPVWVQITDLPLLTIYPQAVADVVFRSLDNGWPRRTLQIVEG